MDVGCVKMMVTGSDLRSSEEAVRMAGEEGKGEWDFSWLFVFDEN